MNKDLDELGRRYYTRAMTGRAILDEMLNEVTASFYQTIEKNREPTGSLFFNDAGHRLLAISEQEMTDA
jgi:hypothetical protein